MAGIRLNHARTTPGWLALLLAVLVISLCLSQRMGLKVACAVDQHSLHSEQITAATLDPKVSSATKEPASEADHDSCSLSEQLLSKVWHALDPLFIAIILLFALWLAPAPALGFLRRPFTPLLFSGRRRHLVLCVFRE